MGRLITPDTWVEIEKAKAMLEQGEKLYQQGKAMKEEAKSKICELIQPELFTEKKQDFVNLNGDFMYFTATINRTINPNALDFFMRNGGVEPDEERVKIYDRVFRYKPELVKKEWNLLSEEQRQKLILESVVSETHGTPKIEFK